VSSVVVCKYLNQLNLRKKNLAFFCFLIYYLDTMLNASDVTDSSTSEDFAIPLYLQIVASIFYIISMILGVGGNILVLLVIFYHQRMKTVTSFFIINMAISDLIVALLCIPSTYLAAYIIQYWPFSAFTCVFFNYMQTVSVNFVLF
jgi:hypothetical protein